MEANVGDPYQEEASADTKYVDQVIASLDQNLGEAASTGNLEILRKALEVCQAKRIFTPFCHSYKTGNNYWGFYGGNIFHIAAWKRQEEFFAEAMKALPKSTVVLLLSQPDQDHSDWNPLHVAAAKGNFKIVRLVCNYYRSFGSIVEVPNYVPPWLIKSKFGQTPFDVAISYHSEDCALKILSMDIETLTKIEDDDGMGPLSRAVRGGCKRVALEILKSPHPYSLRGESGKNPLHYAPYASEIVLEKLLEKHRDLIKACGRDNWSVLHEWARIKTREWRLRPAQIEVVIASELLKDFLDLLYVCTEYAGDNPLHIVVGSETTSTFGEWLVAYLCKHALSILLKYDQVPWLIPNKDGKTPFELAMLTKKTSIALNFAQTDIDSGMASSLLFPAIENDCYEIAETILRKHHDYMYGITSGNGKNVLHDAPKYSEKVATWLIQRLPDLISKPDQNGKTPLHDASEVGAVNLIELMLKADPSALEKVPNAWIEGLKRGHLQAVFAFVNNCSNLTDLCRQIKDTPLHYIQLEDPGSYDIFLRNPAIAELKNLQNIRGETPLHRAIYDRNIHLTEALLKMEGIDMKIRDKKHKTATELLGSLCDQNKQWDLMCDRVAPWLNTTYLQNKANLLEVRNTLSVVAALLATITFTAGFTLPGGVDSNTGEAVLANKPNKVAFLVFLLSDTFAMCCSMLVLVCLIWSMVCGESNKALSLIDRSVSMLMLSLYSTILAFMTGVYSVIHQKTLWAAIVVLVMCSLVAIMFRRSIVYKVFDKFSGINEKEDNEESRLMEEVFVEESVHGFASMHVPVVEIHGEDSSTSDSRKTGNLQTRYKFLSEPLKPSLVKGGMGHEKHRMTSKHKFAFILCS